MSTDKKAFRRILINLIGNAIKYTNQGGVTVTIAPGLPSIINTQHKVYI